MKMHIAIPMLVFGLLLVLPRQASATAQITMVNRTNLQLTLYISDDGQNYYLGCGPALPNGNSCTSSISPGHHFLRATAPNGQSIDGQMDIPDGASPTWTVCYANDNSGPCKNPD
jgi:hypothetical protein